MDMFATFVTTAALATLASIHIFALHGARKFIFCMMTASGVGHITAYLRLGVEGLGPLFAIGYALSLLACVPTLFFVTMASEALAARKAGRMQ